MPDMRSPSVGSSLCAKAAGVNGESEDNASDVHNPMDKVILPRREILRGIPQPFIR